ncbi:MAG TPA: PadR family transcriptional regulator, partial [Micromonosporaceae bacterium]
VADLSSLASDIEREVRGSVRDIKRELRDATKQARTPSRPPWSWPQSSDRPDGDHARQDLDRSIAELTAEVRRLARDHGVRESDLRAATAVVASALTELRRLLRPR